MTFLKGGSGGRFYFLIQNPFLTHFHIFLQILKGFWTLRSSTRKPTSQGSLHLQTQIHTVPALPSLYPSLTSIYLLPSSVHPTRFPFCFFPDFLVIFTLLSSNNNQKQPTNWGPVNIVLGLFYFYLLMTRTFINYLNLIVLSWEKLSRQQNNSTSLSGLLFNFNTERYNL